MNLDERLLRQARQSRLALTLTIAAGFGAGILTVLQAGVLSSIIGQAILGSDLSNITGQLNAPRLFLRRLPLLQGAVSTQGLLFLLLALIFLRAGLVWGSEIAASAIARKVKTILRARLYRVLLASGPAYTSDESTGELTSIFLEGVDALDAYYSQYLPQLVLAALVPLTFLFFIIPLDWISGLVLLLTAPLIPLFMILIGSMAQSLTRRQWQSLSRMNAYFLDVLQGLTTLKLFDRSQAQVQGIAQVSERYRQTTMNVLRVTFLSALALEMVATLSTAVVAVEVGLRLLYGRLAFEQAFFVLLLAPEFYLPLRLLGTRFHAGMAGTAAARRIFQVLEREVPEPSGAVAGNDTLANLNLRTDPVSIRFEAVDYIYDDGRQALKKVSFEIPGGKKTALVGPSGAGKSTIASLLLRFLEPAAGKIMVNDQALSDVPVEAWRGLVAWVPQQPYLFRATIAENIALGKPDAGIQEIAEAARRAQANEFIQKLPHGYQTMLGEHGAGLSAGQAQRIALARAFLMDAPFLILDEATANLDPETEQDVQKAISELLADRTALVIAHRLNTVALCDQVVVLGPVTAQPENEQVLEIGSPASLADSGNLYSQMMQAYQAIGDDRIDTALPTEGLPGDSQSMEAAFEAQGDILPGVQPDTQGWTAEPAGGWRIFRRLVRLASPFKGQIFLSTLTGFATVASGMGLMGTSAYLISAAALHPSIAALQVAIVGVRFFGISRGIFRYLERYLSHQVTFLLLGRWRVTFYQALEPLAPARLERYRSGDLLARIAGDIDALENFYVRVLAPPLVAVLVGLLAAVLLLSWADIRVVIAFILFYLLAGVGTPLLAHELGRRPGLAYTRLRGDFSAAVVESIQGLAILLAYGQGQHQAERLNTANQVLVHNQQQLAWINGLQDALVTLFSQLGMWAVLITAIPLVNKGQLAWVYLAVVVLTAWASFEAVLPLPLAAQVLEGNLQSARRLYEIVDTQPEVTEPPAALPAPVGFNISVEELSFTYPPPVSFSGEPGDGQIVETVKRQSALEEVSFALRPGQKLAVVGTSGAGKSTLINLLLRFWDYRQGSLKLDGQELKGYHPGDVRASMAVVAQDTYLFHSTIRENLLLARPSASPAELSRAIELAQLGEFLRALPDGLDTRVGEQGVRISAGQRQRLAIARAILKAAPVLLLDEPTANLDALTEQALLHDLLPLMDGRSVLYISHRLVGMDQMDEILVLRDGRIIERGSHIDLLAWGGAYRKMYEIQHQIIE